MFGDSCHAPFPVLSTFARGLFPLAWCLKEPTQYKTNSQSLPEEQQQFPQGICDLADLILLEVLAACVPGLFIFTYLYFCKGLCQVQLLH